MLLTIHNLPATTRYADIKSLLQSKCGLQQVILDNLVGEGTGKKVTVGVAEDADAAILVRKINGLYWNGQQLYVEDVRRQKNASEQPFRSAIPETQDEQSFRSMNLQQHSSFPKGVPMPMEMAPTVPPMMTAMYYVPDYDNQEFMQGVSGMQANFMQGQNFDQMQKVQNAYMGIGGQTTQMPQVAMPQYNQDFSSSEAQNQSLPWEDSYNEKQNFAAERPVYGQPPANGREVDWVLSHRESPPRNDRAQPWAGRGDPQARPMQPDFRPNVRPDDRPGFKKPRPDFRSNDRSSLLPNPAQPEFGSIDRGRPNQFTGAPHEFPEVPNKRQRTDEHERFAGSNEFGRSNARRGPDEFSGRTNARRGPNEVSGGPNEFSGRPNEFSGRPNARRGPTEFSGGPNEFSERSNQFTGGQNARREPNEFSGGPNDFSGRSNERRGPNEFSRKPNELHGPNEFSGGPNARRGPNAFSGGMNERGNPNELSRRSNDRRGPNQFSERPNQRRGPNEFSGRPNEVSGRQNEHQRRPNEYQGRPNEHQGRPNEFTGRKGRPNDRPGLPKPNREFGRTNERDEFNPSFDRAEFSRRDRPERNRPIPDSRKRKFEQVIERPTRVSRPRPNKNKLSLLDVQVHTLDEAAKAKLSKKLFFGGVRRIVYEISTNLGMNETDLDTRQAFRKLITDRMEAILDGRTMVQPLQCYEIYRSMYPEMGDKKTYDTVLAMVSKKNEPVGIVKEAVVAPKPVQFKARPAPAPLPPKLTKGQREVIRKQKEAQSLLAQGKLPSFPQGDKRKVAQQRKEEKEGHIPEVDVKYKLAIEEELNKFGDVFIHEFNNAPTAAVQRAYNVVNKSELVFEIKQNLNQNLARRISNSGLKVVRIYGCPTLPKRAELEKFLLKLGVQSLRKSIKGKMYTAAVDTYDTLDKLCSKEMYNVGGGMCISFKPFHMAIKQRADQRMLKTMRKKVIADMIDKTELNLLDKDWPAREAEIKAAQEAEAEAKAAIEAEAALEAEADLEAEAAKTSEVEAAIDAELQEKNDETVQKAVDLNESDSKDVNAYLNDDFHVIDEVNESDSDVEFTGDVDTNEPFELSDDENNGDVDENNGDVGENNGDVDENNGDDDVNNGDDENNDNDEKNDECENEMDDACDNDFDVGNVDVNIDDLNDDDLEDY